MVRYKFIRLFFLFSIMMTSYQSFCGWIISEKSTDEKGNSQVQTIRVQNNLIRFDDDATLTVFDLNEQSVIIAFKGKKIFWSGSLQEFKDGITGAFRKQMQYLINNAPEDQRYYFENLFQNYLETISRQPEKKQVDLKIKELESGIMIKGFKTNKFNVYVNDTLKETLWITEQINPYAGIDMEKLLAFNKELSPFDEHNSYALTAGYLDLIKKGMTVRSVIHYTGHEKITTEVKEIQKIDLQPEEFGPPQGFRKVELTELLNGFSGINE